LKIVQSKRFTEELRRIARYIHEDKPSAARTFVQNLKKKITLLADSPYQYKRSIYFSDDAVRDMAFMGYTIVYEVNENENMIVLLSIFNRNLPDFE